MPPYCPPSIFLVSFSIIRKQRAVCSFHHIRFEITRPVAFLRFEFWVFHSWPPPLSCNCSFQVSRKFEISSDMFWKDGQPFQIIGGDLHYFRVLPEVCPTDISHFYEKMFSTVLVITTLQGMAFIYLFFYFLKLLNLAEANMP